MTAYIRAYPEIALRETYRYRSNIRETAITTPVRKKDGTPDFEGTLTVKVPYFSTQKEAGFNNKAQLDFFRLKMLRRIQEDTDGQIGFLGFEKIRFWPDASRDPLSDLGPSLSLKNSLLPLQIRVGDLERRRDANQQAVLTAAYPVGEIPEFDVQVRAKLEPDFVQGGFRKSQTLTLEVDIKSKGIVERWRMEQCHLDWPFGRSWALDYTGNWEFDPENERVKLQEPERFREGGLHELSLEISEASRIADLTVLRGKIVLVPEAMVRPDLPPHGLRWLDHARLMSGLVLRYFDATGAEQEPEKFLVEAHSAVAIDLEVDLGGVFQRRMLPTRRLLVFDGVIPEAERVADVKSALMDAGVQLKDGNLPGNAERRAGARGRFPLSTLRGHKQLGGSTCNIVVNITGEETKVNRQLALAGGGFTQMTIESGRLDIEIEGNHDDFKLLNGLIGTIQTLLKERLERFKVV